MAAHGRTGGGSVVDRSDILNTGAHEMGKRITFDLPRRRIETEEAGRTRGRRWAAAFTRDVRVHEPALSRDPLKKARRRVATNGFVPFLCLSRLLVARLHPCAGGGRDFHATPSPVERRACRASGSRRRRGRTKCAGRVGPWALRTGRGGVDVGLHLAGKKATSRFPCRAFRPRSLINDELPTRSLSPYPFSISLRT